MHGNVYEWCQDHWHGNYKGAPTDGSAWLSEDDEAFLLRRGGSWIVDPRYCRSTYRGLSHLLDEDDNADGDRGFRVVCVAPRTL